MVYRRRKIRYGYRSVDDFRSMPVAGSQHHAGPDPAAPQCQTETAVPVIASGTSRVTIQSGGAAELSGRDHNGVLKQSPVRQIVEQRRIPLIVRRDFCPQPGKHFRVMIPAVSDIAFDRDKPHARFDQSPGQQQSLPDPVPAVVIPRRIRLLRQVKGILRLFRSDHGKRTLLELVVCLSELELAFDTGLKAVYSLQQPLAVSQTDAADRFGSREFLDGKARGIGIPGDKKRVIGAAEVSAQARTAVVGTGQITDLDKRRRLACSLFLLPGQHRTRQSGLATLAKEIRLQTSIDVSLKIHEMRLSDKNLFLHPFLILIGDRGIQPLSTAEQTRLKTWLEAGGTLYVDNVGVSGPSSEFDRTFRREMERMFPGEPIQKISPDHVFYRSFYRIDYPAGRIIARPYLEAIPIEGRLAVIYSQNDIVDM